MRGSCDKEVKKQSGEWGLVASLFSTLGLLCLLVLPGRERSRLFRRILPSQIPLRANPILVDRPSIFSWTVLSDRIIKACQQLSSFDFLDVASSMARLKRNPCPCLSPRGRLTISIITWIHTNQLTPGAWLGRLGSTEDACGWTRLSNLSPHVHAQL
jgi:hypothetical protein